MDINTILRKTQQCGKCWVYDCEVHDDGATTTACRYCPHYTTDSDPPSVSQKIDWAVAITTAPRKEVTLPVTVTSLMRAGWINGNIYAEPGSKIPKGLDCYRQTFRPQKMGAYQNWRGSLEGLLEVSKDADAYAIFQDDIVVMKGLRWWLDSVLWPSEDCGLISLIRSSSYRYPNAKGWFQMPTSWYNKGMAGAWGFIFRPRTLKEFLASKLIREWPRPAWIDGATGRWFGAQDRWKVYTHFPSLGNHVSQVSTLKHAMSKPNMRCTDFPGS
jgi:hypothetical protein